MGWANFFSLLKFETVLFIFVSGKVVTIKQLRKQQGPALMAETGAFRSLELGWGYLMRPCQVNKWS